MEGTEVSCEAKSEVECYRRAFSNEHNYFVLFKNNVYLNNVYCWTYDQRPRMPKVKQQSGGCGGKRGSGIIYKLLAKLGKLSVSCNTWSVMIAITGGGCTMLLSNSTALNVPLSREKIFQFEP